MKVERQRYEIRGDGRGELDYHIIGVMSGSAREDEVGGGRDEDVQKEEEGSQDYCMLSI